MNKKIHIPYNIFPPRGFWMMGTRNHHIPILGVTFILLTTFIPLTVSSETISSISLSGYDKGVSWKPVVPLKKVILVNFDRYNYTDDFAYLSAVPAAIFYDKTGDRLFSCPLLYYVDRLSDRVKSHQTLDARKGIDYFMEDWLSYCNGRLDQMILINVDKSKVERWPARKISEIGGSDPYTISAELALHEWSYSKEAVIAVIDDEIKNPGTSKRGVIEGTIPAGYTIDKKPIEMKEPHIGVGGNYKAFEVEEPYKYIIAHLTLKNLLKDLDLQLYDDQLGMTDASSSWNVYYGPHEIAGSYVYHYGKWEVGVTYMPTQRSEGIMESKYRNVDEDNSLLPMFGSKGNMVRVDVTLYPGIVLTLNDSIPYGCRDVEFKLRWNNPKISLGMVILDAHGAETAMSPSKDEIINGDYRGRAERTIKLKMLGETKNDSHYSICIFFLDNITQPVDFTIEYSWHQNITREDGDHLASATEGAILASILNIPLLYTSTNHLPKVVKDVLYKLGVEEIHLVDLGSHSSQGVLDELRKIGDVKIYGKYKEIYSQIRNLTERNDIVFSTIDPWTYYYAGKQKPAGEWKGALFIGPAAYIAAHHGAPVLIVDNHPELSQAVVWHQKFWADTAHLSARPRLPSVACMILTGKAVIDFLEKLGYDLPKSKDEIKTMITVADQFEMGPTWDRAFVGRVVSGRFCGSPVDTSYWISRTVFYPALVFVNPATDPEGIRLINGSRSIIKPYVGKLMKPLGTDLVIIKPSEEEIFRYPVLHTFDVYLYKFNQIAKKHWGGVYTSANGITPYETPSPHPIDVGVTDKVGAYYPDISQTEVLPIYCNRAGYSNVYSTNFSAVIENLNRGVIMWMACAHGGNNNNGTLAMWNPDSPYVKEPNPWRAYERPLLSPKNWNEFIGYLPEILKGMNIDLPGEIFKFLRILTKPIDIILDILMVDKGCTENPDVAVTNPDIGRFGRIPAMLSDSFGVDLRIKESKGLSLIPIIGRIFRSYHDGIVIDPMPGGENVMKKYNGFDFDKALKNLHSAGIHSIACLTAHTYLHLTLIRHGSVYQIMDPWTTSWYSGLWLQSIPRDIALGYRIGEAYERGMAMVGVEYLVNQWWWDLYENVVFYGDPSLRVWTPKNNYGDANHWEREDVKPLKWDGKEFLHVGGHALFGTTEHPRARTPSDWMQYGVMVLLTVFILVVLAGAWRMAKMKKTEDKKRRETHPSRRHKKQ